MELYLGRHTTNYAVVCFYHLYVPLWHTMSHWAQPALHDTSLESQPSAERQEGVNPAQGSSAGQERAWGGKGFLLPVEHTVLFRPTPSRSLWEEWNVRKVVLGTGCCRETTDVSGHWGAKGWLPLLLSSDSPFYEEKVSCTLWASTIHKAGKSSKHERKWKVWGCLKTCACVNNLELSMSPVSWLGPICLSVEMFSFLWETCQAIICPTFECGLSVTIEQPQRWQFTS